MTERMPADSNEAGESTSDDPRQRSEQQWRALLTEQEYQVLRQAGTEAPFTGEYTDTEASGTYCCRACGAELFSSAAKFHSGCGWPSFFTPLAGDAVILRSDPSLGRVRTEVLCSGCGSHLGHVFDGEGFDTPTDQRWCINSISLRLDESDDSGDQPCSDTGAL